MVETQYLGAIVIVTNGGLCQKPNQDPEKQPSSIANQSQTQSNTEVRYQHTRLTKRPLNPALPFRGSSANPLESTLTRTYSFRPIFASPVRTPLDSQNNSNNEQMSQTPRNLKILIIGGGCLSSLSLSIQLVPTKCEQRINITKIKT